MVVLEDADWIRYARTVIAACELAERFSYYGSTVVFVSTRAPSFTPLGTGVGRVPRWTRRLRHCYCTGQTFSPLGCHADDRFRVLQTNFIQQPLPPGSKTGADLQQPGALGLGQRASTGLGMFNTFWYVSHIGSSAIFSEGLMAVVCRVYVIPLFGAYIADTRWGRYKTVSVAVAIAMVGHVLLIISSVPGVIERPNAALPCFIIAIIVMGVGTGGFKANISPLVAEQYKRYKLFIGHTKSGERVIVDPIMTTQKIYMYFYLFINVGALVGQITMVYSEMVRRLASKSSSFARADGVCYISMWASTLRLRCPPSSSSSALSSFGLDATCTRHLLPRAPCSPPRSASCVRR